jgi:hypothetical protein
MFILAFVLLVALGQFATNKILHISTENTVGYSYTKRDSLILIGFLGIGILLQVIQKNVQQIPSNTWWIILASYSGALALIMIVLATIKKVIVEKQNEEREKIFEVIKPVLGLKKGDDEFDPNRWEEYNIELGFEKTQVNRITIKVNPDKFKLEQAANLCNTLNLYLPNYEWLPEPNLPARQCSFVGAPLPPHIAKYPGSWLRPAEFVPIGLSGLGEVSWNLNTIKNEGRSLYVYEDGKIAQTVDTPSAPQALCVGSTGGGKSVTLRNVIFHCIEHNNKISVGLIDIKQTEFYPFKGVNGVVAVANSVQEGAELLRIARAVMYSRNKKMQKIGLNDMADYKPHDWTGKIWITGREFDKDEKILVKVNGQEQEMTALQVYEYLYE